MKNKMEGKGLMLYKSGARYDGDWKQNLRDGSGTHKYSNGDMYEG